MIEIGFVDNMSDADKVKNLKQFINLLIANRDEAVDKYTEHVRMNESHSASIAVAAMQHMDHSDKISSTTRRQKAEYDEVSLKVNLQRESIINIGHIFSFDIPIIEELGLVITEVDPKSEDI